MRHQAEVAIGARVCAYDDMRHRKLAIIDGRILWEGSLNIISNGGRSREVMRRAVSYLLCQQLAFFIGANPH